MNYHSFQSLGIEKNFEGVLVGILSPHIFWLQYIYLKIFIEPYMHTHVIVISVKLFGKLQYPSICMW